MAEPPQTSKSFFELPIEIRKIIYKHFFGSLHVRVRDIEAIQKACPQTKSISANSNCNLLLTNKKIHQEAKPHFLSDTTFYLLPGHCGDVIHPLPLFAMGIHHLAFSLADPETGKLNKLSRNPVNTVRGLVTRLGKDSALQVGGSIKLETITYPWVHDTITLVDSIETKLIDSLIMQSLNHARTVVLWMTPTYSGSDGRVCKIRIHDDGVIDISGPFMNDLKDIASTLQGLTNLNNSVKIIRMTKTYWRPATETITLKSQDDVTDSNTTVDIQTLVM